MTSDPKIFRLGNSIHVKHSKDAPTIRVARVGKTTQTKTKEPFEVMPAPKAWREALRHLTGNGQVMLQKLLEILSGEPMAPRTPDPLGRTYEPRVPTVAEQMHAAQVLWEYLHGKAVAQTEVVKAHEQQKQLERLEAMTDEELRAFIEAEDKRKALVDIDEAPTNALPTPGSDGTTE